jgi:drug/metabolite transporter (DMT)-like permease
MEGGIAFVSSSSDRASAFRRRTGLYVFLLGRWTASAVSYVLLLQPVATIAYSAILTHEPVTPVLFIGGAVVVLGVYIGAFGHDDGGEPVDLVASRS